MLHLYRETSTDWVALAVEHIDVILLDHAHCEKKAASTAVNLVFRYTHVPHLMRPLSELAREELRHFELMLDTLTEREIPFVRLRPSPYAGRLMAAVRKGEPERFVDLCLVAALIEARSCERFALMRDHLADAELAAFYGSLFESEARHYMTYVRLAERRADAEVVRARLAELAALEAEIVRNGDGLCRLHS